MSKRTIGFIMIALGVVGVVVSLAADVIGIGAYAGISWLQMLGAVISLIVASVGVRLAQSRADQKK